MVYHFHNKQSISPYFSTFNLLWLSPFMREFHDSRILGFCFRILRTCVFLQSNICTNFLVLLPSLDFLMTSSFSFRERHSVWPASASEDIGGFFAVHFFVTGLLSFTEILAYLVAFGVSTLGQEMQQATETAAFQPRLSSLAGTEHSLDLLHTGFVHSRKTYFVRLTHLRKFLISKTSIMPLLWTHGCYKCEKFPVVVYF